MKAFYLAILSALFSIHSYTQDLIYTVAGVYQDQYVALDSILLENLSNNTRILFGPLMAKNEYELILNRSVDASIDTIWSDSPQFSVTHNIPGTIRLKYNNSTPEELNILIYNSNGQLTYSSAGDYIYPGASIDINLGATGAYFIQIGSRGSLETFKAIGAPGHNDKFHTRIIASQKIEKHLKGTGPDNEFRFEIGDSIRISAYKQDFYAWPVNLTIIESDRIEFPFNLSTVNTTGISDAYIPLDEQMTIVSTFDDSTGQMILIFEGEEPELKPGSIITANLDSTYVLRKVLSVISDGDSSILETAPAYLNEVFIDKAFKIHTGYMAPNSQLKSTSSLKEISKALTDEEGFIHPYEVIYRDNRGELIKQAIWNSQASKGTNADELPFRLLTFEEDLNRNIFSSSNGVVNFFSHDSKLELKLDFCGEFEFDPSLGTISEDTKVKRSDIIKYDYWLEGQADLVYLLTLILTDEYEASPDEPKLLLPLGAFTVNFVIGVIPVSITFDNNLFYDYAVNASATMEANWGFEYHHNLKLGASYDKDENDFSLIKESDPSLEIHPLEIKGEVHADARVEVFPRIEVLFYKFFGPYFDLTPFLTGDFNLAGEFSTFHSDSHTTSSNFVAWDTRFGVGLDFRVGAKMQGFWGLINREFGPKVFHLLKDKDNPEIPTREIYSAPYKLERVNSIPDEAEIGNQITLRFKVSNYSIFDRLDDKPVPFCPIHFEGDGTFSKHIVFTDQYGEAEVNWTPDREGNNKFNGRIYNADRSIIWESKQSVFIEGEYSENNGTFTDSRDDESYNWVRIGNQIWMAENLRYISENGSFGIVPGSHPDLSVSTYRDTYIYPYYYVYDYNGINENAARSMSDYDKYGVLYNYKAATLSCPEDQGWYLPAVADWEALEEFVAQQYGYTQSEDEFYWNGVGGRLKATEWNGTDDFGFNALPGGMRDRNDGRFKGQGYNGYWWSSTPWLADCSYLRQMYSDDRIYNQHLFSQYGFSVRCIKK